MLNSVEIPVFELIRSWRETNPTDRISSIVPDSSKPLNEWTELEKAARVFINNEYLLAGIRTGQFSYQEYSDLRFGQ